MLYSHLPISGMLPQYHNSSLAMMSPLTILCLMFPLSQASSANCGDCTEVSISSNGGAYQHQPSLLGTFTLAGSIWSGLVPYYKSANNHYLTPDRMSDPLEDDYVKWIVADIPMGYNGGIQNRVYTQGVTCPYDIPDQWEYLWGGDWRVDQTMRVTCTGWK